MKAGLADGGIRVNGNPVPAEALVCAAPEAVGTALEHALAGTVNSGPRTRLAETLGLVQFVSEDFAELSEHVFFHRLSFGLESRLQLLTNGAVRYKILQRTSVVSTHSIAILDSNLLLFPPSLHIAHGTGSQANAG